MHLPSARQLPWSQTALQNRGDTRPHPGDRRDGRPALRPADDRDAATSAGRRALDAAPVAVTDRQIPVPEAPMGWASWNSLRRAASTTTSSRRRPTRSSSSGLAAAGYEYVNIDEGWWQGTRDSDGQHHHRRGRVARRHEGHRRLHPQQGPQGGHLHRRRQGRLRLLLPHRPPGGARHRQRGPLRAGHAAVLSSGASTSSRSTGAAATPRASTRRRPTRRSATPIATATADHRPPAGPVALQLGHRQPLELGAGHGPDVAHQHRHHLLRRQPVVRRTC